MVKSELIKIISKKQQGLSFNDVSLCVKEILECLSVALEQHKRIELRGFGSFSLHRQPPRNTHNPKTGERSVTKEKCKPHFKPGKDLKELVDQAK